MMEYDRVRLKQSARQAMRFQRPHPMLITLLYTIIVNIGAQIVGRILGAASGSSAMSALYYQALREYGEPMDAIQYVLLSFGPQRLALALFVGVFISGIITSLWAALMRTGYADFCLGMVRGRQPQTDALFGVFPQWTGVLVTQFLAGLFRSLWALLLGVGLALVIFVAALLFVQLEALFALVLLAAYIAFFLGLIWVTLRYAMVDYLIADQGLTGMDAIRESKRLMQDNTGRLFALRLSFIGWYLLESAIILAAVAAAAAVAVGAGLSAADGFTGGAANFAGISTAMIGGLMIFIPLALIAIVGTGILNLWLRPYITGAEALFYDWARGVDSTPAGGYGFGPSGGWGQPRSPGQPQHFDYTWTPGPHAGTGIGSGPKKDGGDDAPPQPPRQPPRSPKPPRDDPWD